jgi:hypothetical protein
MAMSHPIDRREQRVAVEAVVTLWLWGESSRTC